jgi:hypothetical protein
MGSETQVGRFEKFGSPSVRRDSSLPERRILNSWKEIATYLGRGVRTVQRWEAQLELPVHRPAGKEHGTVLAFSPELDNWLNSRPLRQTSENGSPTSEAVVSPSRELQQIELKLEAILLKIDALTSRLDELSRQLNAIGPKAPYATEKNKLKVGARAQAGAA